MDPASHDVGVDIYCDDCSGKSVTSNIGSHDCDCRASEIRAWVGHLAVRATGGGHGDLTDDSTPCYLSSYWVVADAPC